MNTYILPALGRYTLSQLSPHLLQSFYNSLLRGNQDQKPLNPKSIRNIHGILHKCLSITVKLEYMRRNPADSVTLPRVERKEINPLTDEQVSRVVYSAGNDGFGILFKVIVFTGLRLGEALGLTWDRVDFKKKRLTISKQLQKQPLKDGGFVFYVPKKWSNLCDYPSLTMWWSFYSSSSRNRNCSSYRLAVLGKVRQIKRTSRNILFYQRDRRPSPSANGLQPFQEVGCFGWSAHIESPWSPPYLCSLVSSERRWRKNSPGQYGVWYCSLYSGRLQPCFRAHKGGQRGPDTEIYIDISNL